jgi:hypothetical protein
VNGRFTGGEYQTPGESMLFLTADSKSSGIRLLMGRPYFLNSTVSKVSELWKFASGTIYSLSTKTSLAYGPLDGAPGGMFDVQDEFYKASEGVEENVPWPFGWAVSHVSELTHNISFIPTVSGLAINDPNFDWRTKLDLNDIRCNHKTPFDNFYVPTNDEDHTQLTIENVAWIKEELANNQQNCSTICANLNGPNLLHIGYTGTYTLSGSYPAGAQVTWIVTPNLSVASSTSNSVTVQSIGLGKKVVTARIQNYCGGYVDINYQLMPTFFRETQLDSTLSGGLAIYPNPSSDEWNLKLNYLDKTNSFSATAYNVMGQKVWEYNTELHTDIIKIDNRNFSKGVYLLKVIRNGKKEVAQIVK